VLHGGMYSGLHVISRPGVCQPSCMFRCFDIYRNGDKLRKISCPVLLIHGCDDEVISFSHSERLNKVMRIESKYPPYWVSLSALTFLCTL
jgi:pimeloyl-ACP methyl ester carboxylesterase